jgi:hypothetical protein
MAVITTRQYCARIRGPHARHGVEYEIPSDIPHHPVNHTTGYSAYVVVCSEMVRIDYSSPHSAEKIMG